MSEINNEMLEKFKKEYLDNEIFTIGRNALTQNSISSLVYVKEQERNVQKNFTIDLNNLPVLNQGASRRCWIYSGLESIWLTNIMLTILFFLQIIYHFTIN